MRNIVPHRSVLKICLVQKEKKQKLASLKQAFRLSLKKFVAASVGLKALLGQDGLPSHIDQQQRYLAAFV